MAPTARRPAENVNVYVAGSVAVASFHHVAWRRLVPLRSLRMRVQPAGGVIVELPRMTIEASRTSPVASVAGRGTTSVVAIALLVA